MRFLAPILLVFSLVCLTSPDGFAVWLNKDQIVSVHRPVDGECSPAAKSRIGLGNGNAVCVQEERSTIVKKVDGAK